jgi:vacuole morphology and inheritance protein 14
MSAEPNTVKILLKNLSDHSEEVVKRDLQLLAQISHHSDAQYFTQFMVHLLNLFSTDRKLLEARGSLIIRQLCHSLDPERMYRTFAEVLEKDEDIEFASLMVQNLNIILITAPELLDIRKRLKNIEFQDNSLFVVLYKCWSHNPVALFSLCLLASAYEHAVNLLQILAEMEITVSLLIQLDKLVQLLESPVFTYLRLQLLEPGKYPHLFKCLYGILMLLPQSSAFATLRNRLNSVNSLVTLNVATGSVPVQTSGGSKRY